nr:MAG TPA: RNA polymerase subunit [Caudoviricetes sp.]
MADYIERERARHECKYFFKGNEKAQEDCESLLCDLPAADVAPVRRGHWVRVGDGTTCSECLTGMKRTNGIQTEWVDLSMMLFCPRCGAKMDKEKSHAN